MKFILQNFPTMTKRLQKSFRHSFSFFVLILFIAACSTTEPVKQPAEPQTPSTESTGHPTTNATLWMQHAAEYRALTLSIYRTAASNLALAIEDSYWTAYPQQENDSIRKLPPAIIVDVDETVLNNAAFQARMIRQNSSYDPQKWNSWVMEAKADAVAGALPFLQRVADEGIAIFYITNRDAKVEEGTRKNLQELGFPLSQTEDRILCKNERENWTSAKIARRQYVANKHRILMLFGDNLNDFVNAEDLSQKERTQLMEKYNKMWGWKWFMLPNPVYGSWE